MAGGIIGGGRLRDLAEAGWLQLEPMITHRVPLEEAGDAFGLLPGRQEDGDCKAMPAP
jgi:threonine dehydrogenase-like Zn-dependent dehydrogenase